MDAVQHLKCEHVSIISNCLQAMHSYLGMWTGSRRCMLHKRKSAKKLAMLLGTVLVTTDQVCVIVYFTDSCLAATIVFGGN